MSGERPSRSALIVANDEYADPRLRQLRAPVRDAEALGRVLADPAIGGFAVDVVLNEPEHRVRRKLSEFFAERARDDLLLVHFSCHGLKDDDGSLYFATPDSVVGHLDSTAVSSEFVNRQMRRSRSRRIALFLDCCYSGAFSRGASARAGDGLELAERFDGQGQVVITASTATEYAFEGDELTGSGTPSVFTTAIVEGLESGDADRDGDGLVSIDELYDYVYDRVRERTPSQTPSKWTYDLQGELYVARNRNPRPAEPAELPADLRQALENRLAFVRAGAVSELELLLGGTNRRLAAAARAALETLTEDDSRSVSDAAAAALRRHAPADAPALQPPVPLPATERVRAVVMPVESPATRGPVEAPVPDVEETAAQSTDAPAAPTRLRRFPRRRAPAAQAVETTEPPAAAPAPAVAPPGRVVEEPAPQAAPQRAARDRGVVEAVVLAVVAAILLLGAWDALAPRAFARHYAWEGVAVPLLVLAAAGWLLLRPARRMPIGGALFAMGLQGFGLSLSAPRYDSYNLDNLDQRAALLIGYGSLAVAGLLAVGGRLATGADGRPRRSLAIGVVGGWLLLLAGYTGAWTYSDNNGSELGLWHNEWTAGRLGLLLSLAVVALAAVALALGRGPERALIGGALVGLGIQAALHFAYLTALNYWFDELNVRTGTALGLVAGVVLAVVGVLVLLRAQAPATPSAETTS